MPFALRFNDGTYLKRTPNTSMVDKRRSRTADLDSATTWSKIGGAKLAIIAAVNSGDIKPTEEVEITEVTYRIKAIAGKFSTKATKTGRSLVMVVSR